MPRKTGRDAGNGQFIPLAQAAAMGERATIETIDTDEVTTAMENAALVVCNAFAEGPRPASDDELRGFARNVYRAMRAARPR
jgi:hypothetical protein